MIFGSIVIGGLLLLGLGIARVRGNRGTKKSVETLFDEKADGR
jgi:uncharacterized integral membrane protein